ncbi:hypothetical protein [Pararcticibacter amylolyticus]|uniref:Cell wall anchor protein n=1 Tax=Pararcticibacter amylolyticus TaxID=2173175 RepID=A0A2U2P9U1_9SPHI|nr:hypothetical protein [Pararcticibacter amylolyticus]PWG78064.1 hypothetical protein DDR33_24135 [Pararcticibacter amylolyticus]
MKFSYLILVGSFLTGANSFAQTNTFPSTGKVGIGVLNPQTELEVNGLTKSKELLIDNNPGSDTKPDLTSVKLITRNGEWALYTAPPAGGWGVRPNAFEVWEYPGNGGEQCCRQRFVIDKSADVSDFKSVVIDRKGGLALGGYWDAGNNKLSVDGNVGIGTTDSKGYKLAVNGDIRAKEVKVEAANWPDYVFASTYKIPELQVVEDFIQKNQHLPGIPSASEIKDNGVNLGQINTALLKKVEELTLYIIEQNKKLEGVIQQNAQHQEKLKKLEELLKVK